MKITNHLSESKTKNWPTRFFVISLLFKAIDGALEFIGGLILLFFKINTLQYIVIFLTRHELLQDPDDLIANWLIDAANHLSLDFKILAAAYLIAHGVIKISLIIALLKNKFWAYPAAISFLLLFIYYQSYRFTLNHSLALFSLTLFDLLVVVLIWRQYKIETKKLL